MNRREATRICRVGGSEQPLRKTIRAGEMLGAGVVLVPGFRETCPE